MELNRALGIHGDFRTAPRRRFEFRESSNGRPRMYRAWTPAEERYLATNWGRTSQRAMRVKLGRSWHDIKLAARRMELSKYDEEYGYPLEVVATVTGRDKDTLRRWIEIGFLKGRRRCTDRPNDLWGISPVILSKWMREHPGEIHYWKIPREAWPLFVDILLNGTPYGFGEFGPPVARETHEAETPEAEEE